MDSSVIRLVKDLKQMFRQTFLSLILIITAYSYASGAELSIPNDLEAAPGSEVLIPMQIDDATGVSGYFIGITFDSNVLTYVPDSATNAGTLTDGIFLTPIVNSNVPGELRFGSAGFSALTSGSGNLFTFRLMVSDTAEEGVLPINFIEGFTNLNDGQIPVTLDAGELTITATVGCSPEFSSPSAGFGSSGGSGVVSLDVIDNCEWTASIDVSWVNLTSPDTGTGDTTLFYQVEANAGVGRSGSIRVGSATHVINQSSGCSISVSEDLTIPSEGVMNESFQVSASDESCSWTITGIPDWITNLDPIESAGTQTVSFDVSENNGPERQVTLSIEDQELVIAQEDGCEFTAPETIMIGDSGASGFTINFVTSNQSCLWEISEEADWITVISQTTGTGSGSITLDIEMNDSFERSAELIIANTTIKIMQDGLPTPYSDIWSIQ